MLNFNPTGLEQEMLELLNRMRLNPAAEYDKLGNSGDPDVEDALEFFEVDLDVLASQWNSLTSVPPLAWSGALINSALTHNQLMIEFDQQSHNLPGEPKLGDRIANAGYENWSAVGENIFAFAESPFQGHAAFAIDWGNGPGGIQDPPGHRNVMMSDDYREVGISIVPEKAEDTDVGPLVVTQHFGNRRDFGDPWLLGVVFRDGDSDNFYDSGEGLGNVTVEIVGVGKTFQAQTLSAGAYQVQVPKGTYRLTFSGGSLEEAIVQDVTVASENVKLDANAAGDNPLPPLSDHDSDLNGDGQSDILYQNTNTAENVYFDLANNTWVAINTTSGWQPAAIGPLTGDSNNEILYHNPSTGQNFAYNLSTQSWSIFDTTPGWEPRAIADLNGDSRPDILFYNRSSGESVGRDLANDDWFGLHTTPQWLPVAVADWSGDGVGDTVFHNLDTAENVYLDGLNQTWSAINTTPGWMPFGVTDLNDDGVNDLAFANLNTGENVYLNGANNSWASLNTTPGWMPLVS